MLEKVEMVFNQYHLSTNKWNKNCKNPENMSIVNLTNIEVLQNPGSFNSPIQFEITFECLSQLESDLEFKIIYGKFINECDFDISHP